MSNIRTQFFHKGIMLGVCLIGALISTYFPMNGSENTKETLLVEHHIEQQSSEEDINMKMSSEKSDSLLSVD
ncbi:hypothetical protein [uncultured Muriicola sp.]|uniref:hypothetical protein n=1 Tax=uncultured Muriicola sp. TaxID=1583102 RepID=UPI00260E85B2|nr:hypothetical protein [uncultured Muriicola sp.]